MTSISFDPSNVISYGVAVFESILGVVALAIISTSIYNIYFHPLAAFPGPWYSKASSLPLAVISYWKREPDWLLATTRKYGADRPIRIAPSMLLFPKPSSLKDIYRDPQLNTKSNLYGTGMLGPPHLFSTLDGEEHRMLRKAIAGNYWSIGSLKRNWEPRIDELVRLFVQKRKEDVKTGKVFCLSDRVAEFAADVMTTIAFTNPWGFVEAGRDQKGLLESWRYALDRFGFVGRFYFMREYIMRVPFLAKKFLPKMSQNYGMGFLMSEAARIVSEREKDEENGIKPDQPDFMQYALDARIDGERLSQIRKQAHAALLIQAGADTTGTGLGSTMRFLATHPDIVRKAVGEIQEADEAGKLSDPIQHEEAADHLPYVVACIKESLRLNPPASNLFARVVKERTIVDGHEVPSGVDITSNAYVVQRGPELYGPDPDAFRPERWLEDKERAQEMEACSFVFGIGPRVCLGKEVATMELYKLIPEILRNFDIEVIREGQYVVAGGVAYNRDFDVKMHKRKGPMELLS